MNLLQFTTIPEYIEKFKMGQINNDFTAKKQSFKDYDTDDFMSWMTTNNETHSNLSLNIANKINLLLEGKINSVAELDFVNNHTKLLGETPSILELAELNQLFNNPTQKKNIVETLAKSFYRNEPGLLTGKEMVELLHSFFLKS